MKTKLLLTLFLISFLFIAGCDAEVRIRPLQNISCDDLCKRVYDVGGATINCGVKVDNWCECYNKDKDCFDASPESYLIVPSGCN